MHQSRLQPAIFPPTEFCPGGFLYILERGLVLYSGRPRRQGSIWGDDVLLNNPELECGFPAVAVSYTWVLACDGKTLISGSHDKSIAAWDAAPLDAEEGAHSWPTLYLTPSALIRIGALPTRTVEAGGLRLAFQP